MAFQYSLRRLFIWVSILSFVLGIVGWRLHVARERDLAFDMADRLLADCGGYLTIGQAHENYYVRLSDSSVTDESFHRMAECFRKFTPRNLDGRGNFSIDIKNTAITDKSIPEFAGIKKLWSIDLSGTNVSDASIPHLCKLHLMRLTVIDTKITPQGARRLKKAMPDCKIVYGILINGALFQPAE